MASFLFVFSTDNRPLELEESRRLRAKAALEERSGGSFEEFSTPTSYAAVSGPEGTLRVSDEQVTITDGIPEIHGGALDLGNLPGKADCPGSWSGLEGSFALCAFFRGSGSLVLARDPFGTRPVFYAKTDGRVMVASECKVLQALGLDLSLEPDTLRESLLYRWVLRDSHLLKPIVQVPPGTLVSLDPTGSISSFQYWRPAFEPEVAKAGSLEDYIEEIDQALRGYFEKLGERYGRVGLLLSGGVDSSLIAAVGMDVIGSMKAYVGRIPGHPNPETERALKVAEMLGMDCEVVDIDLTRFSTDLPYIVRRMEELPRHPNNLVLNQLFERAGKDVSVVLQGDGTGTLFGNSQGVKTQKFAFKAKRASVLPLPLRKGVASILQRLPSDKAWRLGRVLAWSPAAFARTIEAIIYRREVLHSMGLSLLNPEDWESGDFDESGEFGDANQAFMVQCLERGSLTRHDRLAQPHDVVSLTPFFSPPLWEIARRMPRELRIGRGSKPILRDLLDRYLPSEVSRWKKMGFEVPWREWLEEELLPLRTKAAEAMRDSPHLPPGFWETSDRTNDGEGIFSGLCLYLLLREFDVPM